MSRLSPAGAGTNPEPMKLNYPLAHSLQCVCLETYNYGQKVGSLPWVCIKLAQIHEA